MDGPEIEPRKVMRAVAEVSWEDGGESHRSRASVEETSLSGACLRVKRPFPVGSKVTVKWHREQFSAVARNCRSDGRDFLLGVKREAGSVVAPLEPPQENMGCPTSHRICEKREPSPIAATPPTEFRQPEIQIKLPAPVRTPPPAARRTTFQSHVSEFHPERKVMPPKKLFPSFWRRQSDGDSSNPTTPKEAPVNKPNPPAAETAAPRAALLAYEDIYHAAGIMGPRSGYGIHKVVDMLNSERIRELAPEIKRASVLMALDAAGGSIDELLQDATRRQQALDSYEAGQCRQIDELEAHKTQENAQIQAELDRVTAHYAERMQRNQDQVAQEKDALRNWQMAKLHESQRIREVMELCSKQPAAPESQQTSAPAEKSAATTAPRPIALSQTAGR